jgi:hypothetical protein
VDRCSVLEMETAPKPGRGVPPKRDKPQAKRKVALVGGVRVPGPGSGSVCEGFSSAP